jgi:transposase-like protein
MKKYNFITENFLREEYITKQKSSCVIAKELNCSKYLILKRLKKYNIDRRDVRELNKKRNVFGKNHPSYIDGRTNKIVRCIDCYKQISNEGAKRCLSCNAKNRPKEKHPRWKGGISSLSDCIRGLDENKFWKKEVLKRDRYTCQECFKSISNTLEIHHIKSFGLILQDFLQLYSQFSPIEDKETLVRLAISYEPFWDINNGETLCEECHKLTESYGNSIIEQKYKKDSHGVFDLLE